MPRSLLVIAVLLLGCATTGPAGLPYATVRIGESVKVKAEVAVAQEELQRGLMYRREMPDGHGMIFVYPQERILSFWMKNTYLPLSIAFLDRKGRIVHITDMEPHTTTSHSSVKMARFALEVNQGWFAKKGVQVGDQATFELPDGTVIGR